MTVCLLVDRDDRGFRFGGRVEDLVAEEIEGSQDDAQDEDKGVRGNGERHGKKRRNVGGGGGGEMVR